VPPSLLDDPFDNVPALAQLIDKAGFMSAPTTSDRGHPVLIPISSAKARPAPRWTRSVPCVGWRAFRASDDTVVWGHSQGGHAALWTGILAPTYAPEIAILALPPSPRPAIWGRSSRPSKARR